MNNQIITALGDALNSSPRPPALSGLVCPRYYKAFFLKYLGDGEFTARLYKYGWEYKHRGPRPEKPYPCDPAAVRDALNAVLPDGVKVKAVEDCGTHIILRMEEHI